MFFDCSGLEQKHTNLHSPTVRDDPILQSVSQILHSFGECFIGHLFCTFTAPGTTNPALKPANLALQCPNLLLLLVQLRHGFIVGLAKRVAVKRQTTNPRLDVPISFLLLRDDQTLLRAQKSQVRVRFQERLMQGRVLLLPERRGLGLVGKFLREGG